MTHGMIRATRVTMNPPSRPTLRLLFALNFWPKEDATCRPAGLYFTPNLLQLKPLPHPRDFVLILASERGSRSRDRAAARSADNQRPQTPVVAWAKLVDAVG